ncbi:class I SAM-dependent RNA methyltransferase [Gordonia crocea]|uniref:23S rRNA methyltransferase n=1 Tax=Gordonia crocea TaxID=589162 RepID=A0A7I9UYG1_9ACTN|nr:TRAM domain-containing protein [Gordonia crocea]GED97840.1 23S rRNA methyltransferase [Gordonia crocea]
MPAGARLRCRVDALAHGGAGVARVDGRVVFVSGALPGETVLAEVTDDSREAFWRARAVEIEEPSPDRTPVSCPSAAAGAGCCDLAFGTAAVIRSAKATVLTDALNRIGRIEPPADLAVEALPGGESGHGWRIRARLGVADDGSAVGFRQVHGSAVVAQRCAALTVELADAVAGLDPSSLRPGAEVWAVHDDAGRIHLAEAAGAVPPRPTRGPARVTTQRRRAKRTAPAGPPRPVLGEATVSYRVGNRRWELPVDAFWQAHRGAAGVYADTAAGWLAPWAPDGVVWDLYGGAGVFAGAAADGGARQIHLVDTAPAALAAAQTVFGDRVRSHRAAVSPAAVAGLPDPDVVVLDPPRSGAGNAVMDAVAAAGPAAVVHVGCDPAAFARDIGRLVGTGYRLTALRAFDAFPLTHHVEAMALLVRA